MSTAITKDRFSRIGRRVKRRLHARPPLSETPSIDGKRFLFLGGLHRSGTSILHRVLREHPETSGLSGTYVPEDEGQHLQTVFEPASHYGGPGVFAFDERSRLTETSELATVENRDRLLREWGPYYDLDRSILLEKSPPNLIRSRYFQALFPETRFVFIVRHPIAVALATQKWSKTSIYELLLHWCVAYRYMLLDTNKLKHFMIVRYEDFIRDRQYCLNSICDYINISHFTPEEDIVDHNRGYFDYWNKYCQHFIEPLSNIFSAHGGIFSLFGYRIKEPFIIDPSEDFIPCAAVTESEFECP